MAEAFQRFAIQRGNLFYNRHKIHDLYEMRLFTNDSFLAKCQDKKNY